MSDIEIPCRNISFSQRFSLISQALYRKSSEGSLWLIKESNTNATPYIYVGYESLYFYFFSLKHNKMLSFNNTVLEFKIYMEYIEQVSI